jgi:RimJ/RimL family protein N-acetyltransferase
MLRTPPSAWTIPILETECLRLRAHTLADFPAYCALWADPNVTRHLGCQPNTVEESWARLLRNAGQWSLLGFGSWLVEEKSTGDFVGEVGLFNYKRDIDPPLTSIPEIGWVLSPAKHGLGYATDAVFALIEWARAHFTSTELACIIDPDNSASLRIAAKIGFTPRETLTYRGTPIRLLTRSLNG